MGDLKLALVKHQTAADTRFDNGREVFSELKSKLNEVDTRTQPKPPSVLKIISITLTCVMIAATALWGLSTKLSDRPTTEQLEKIFATHEKLGHQSLRDRKSVV